MCGGGGGVRGKGLVAGMCVGRGEGGWLVCVWVRVKGGGCEGGGMTL